MFSIRDVFARGWAVFRENASLLIFAHLIAVAAQALPAPVPTESEGLRGLLVIVSALLSFVIGLGLVRIALDLVDGRPSRVMDVFSRAYQVFGYVIASILHAAVTGIGLLLLIVPGVIAGVSFSMWPYFMVEHEMGPIESMKASWALTRGSRGRLVLYFIASIGVILLGILALLVGVVVSYAVLTVTGALVYRALQAHEASPEGAAV